MLENVETAALFKTKKCLDVDKSKHRYLNSTEIIFMVPTNYNGMNEGQ